MTQEQKAKCYDNAKYIMKEYLESGNAGVIAENTIRKAFPELMESDDERIRKDIVTYLKSILSNKKYGDKFIESWISWLEKHVDKVEQKHTPKHKVGDTIYYNSFGELKSMIVANVITGGTDNPMYEDGNGNAVFEKDLVEQKTPWSKEDENTIQVLKNIVRHSDEIDENIYTMSLKEKLYDWLKSIKNRVLLQPKQEWNEEDEKMIGNIRGIIEQYAFSKSAVDVNGELCEKEFIDADNWLKSIRPRSQWKPSERQKEALLWCVVHLGGADKQTLGELLEELNKL